MAKQKFYVVWQGHIPGVYTQWADCKTQIEGYPMAKYKSFKTIDAAEHAFDIGYKKYKETYAGKTEATLNSKFSKTKPILKSISVDAACDGSPGNMEYQGVLTDSSKLLFKSPVYKMGNNNIGEFLALVHALAFLKKNNSNLPIYSDSITALSWVRKKKINSILKPCDNNKIIFELMDRALNWLHNNDYNNPLLKWDTENWGEIPADYGRK